MPTRRPVTGRWRCCGVFELAKASAVKARTQTINQLKAVLVAADPAVREATPRCARHCRA